jgi:hypothetical protein
MAPREHYNVNIECSKCGEKGVLEISENDYSFMKKEDREARCATNNFKVSMKDEKTGRAVCKKCDQENFW